MILYWNSYNRRISAAIDHEVLDIIYGILLVSLFQDKMSVVYCLPITQNA